MSRITIILYPNESIIGIHTQTIMDIAPYGERPKSKKLERFIKRLNAAHGVERALVRKYEVSIEKGDAFDWNEIVPTIVTLVVKYCRYTDYELRVYDRRPKFNYNEDGDETTRRFNSPIDLGIAA